MNGWRVTWGRVAPFVVTLGMMAIARGLALVFSGGRPVSNLGDAFTWLGSGGILGVPVLVWVVERVIVLSADCERRDHCGGGLAGSAAAPAWLSGATREIFCDGYVCRQAENRGSESFGHAEAAP